MVLVLPSPLYSLFSGKEAGDGYGFSSPRDTGGTSDSAKVIGVNPSSHIVSAVMLREAVLDGAHLLILPE